MGWVPRGVVGHSSPRSAITLRVPPIPALFAHDYVPPVEAGSAYAPQAIADDDTDGILVLQSVDREKVLIAERGELGPPTPRGTHPIQ